MTATLMQIAALTAIAACVIELALHHTSAAAVREFFGRGEDVEIARIS